LGVERGPQQEALALRYLDLLLRWNRVYNLTSVTDPTSMVRRHLLDSLAAIPFLRGRRLVDVGSGAGLPGIPLAIWLPDRQFWLLDSSGRKTRFLHQVKIELRLTNVEIVQARVQDWRPVQRFEGVLSRAFAPLPELVRQAGHLLAPGGRLHAFKGNWPEPGGAALEEPYAIVALHRLRIPGESAHRHLVEVAAGGKECH
jgi:16S rRNA (guanine527-N7)-methyltransferase